MSNDFTASQIILAEIVKPNRGELQSLFRGLQEHHIQNDNKSSDDYQPHDKLFARWCIQCIRILHQSLQPKYIWTADAE